MFVITDDGLRHLAVEAVGELLDGPRRAELEQLARVPAQRALGRLALLPLLGRDHLEPQGVAEGLLLAPPARVARLAWLERHAAIRPAVCPKGGRRSSR